MKPYRPKTYSFEDAAHLLRRAGFGGSPVEIESYRALGPELAVEKLLSWSEADGTNPNPHDLEARFEADLKAEGDIGKALRRTIPVLYGWWIHKLVNTTQPLKEKLTLFYHGHFATSSDKVRNGFMLRNQNELFRRLGQGKFEALVLEVSRDPAMLRYLDNNTNTKEHPNENYARELMELFTLGVGNYTEKDIQEAARALTGWTFSGNRRDPQVVKSPPFVFNQRQHDTGVKTVLGQSGNFQGQDIVRIVCNQPASARFMTHKLWRFFVNEQIPADVHTELSALWTQSGGNVGTVLREVFNSAEFYDARNRYALIKSPAEYVIGALRSSQARLAPGQQLTVWNLLNQQYQGLFDPPNVRGWDGGKEWIDDSSLLNRLNVVGMVVNGNLPSREARANGQMQNQTRKLEMTLPSATNPAELIELIGRTYLGRSPTGALKTALEKFAGNRVTPEIARGLTYLVLASPQYHLA